MLLNCFYLEERQKNKNNEYKKAATYISSTLPLSLFLTLWKQSDHHGFEHC